jgi:hypothetical protein
VTNVLKLRQVTFFTDNHSLTKAAAAQTTSDPSVLWDIRQHVAQYKQDPQHLPSIVYHVGSDVNGVAHNFAQQDVRQHTSEPIFCCSNSAHVNRSCPITLALQNSKFQGIVLHYVICE